MFKISDIQLPSSTAIDSDGFILESHYNTIPSLFPSALRSEIFALLHGLDSLSQYSKITSSARAIISQKNLEVTLIKVPAHADDSLNNHVDDLAKAAHTDSCLSSISPAFLAPCILQFNSLPVDMNIRKFIGDIFDAKSLLTLALLPRFNLNSSISVIDWACTKFCLKNKQLQSSHRKGRSEFCAFRIKILLDMLPTLTTLQRRKPHIYDPSWLCPQTYFSSSTIYSIFDTPLYDFHFDLYVQIWLCRSVFFHHWESAQGITNKMKSSISGPSPTSHPFLQISPVTLTPSLATASLDSWISWVSSSISSGGSWISHLDFWRRLTVQPLLRFSFW
ncbi:hypothetical protein RhiirC2_773877 [Rhizophagus irregularis]|uniref:RNase H type-1 domain-containing protein n=1 Tax=Rhizophagus irregularis TaxID=588596 RepID=A0A2N1NMN4_9GLOM|nr:hypothetical protein RhiirC2_773877 [Rhizophagus irregularis]